ncbi:MAG: ROK family transcriptional regulator [Actinomycetota bacterium]
MTRPLAGPQSLLRTLNARAILEALARRGPLTRAELMRETGLSRTAVTQVLRMLEVGEAVASAGVDRETHGPAATRVSLHPHLGHAAAVHVDHHSVQVVLVDPRGEVRAEARGGFDSLDDRVELIADLLLQCRQSAPGPVHVAIVAVPGAVTSDGQIRDDRGPDAGIFHAALQARLGCAVRIENDVNLAALAESQAGVGRDVPSFAYLHLDDGLGAGFIVDGALVRGATGLAGEVQYLPQTPLPIGAPVLSDHVIADLALTHGRDPAAPIVSHLDAALDGDETAQAMVAEMGRRLALVGGSIALVLDPAAFLLGGYAAHPAMLAAVRQVADAYSGLITLRFVEPAFGREGTLVGAVREATEALKAVLFTRLLATDRKS